MTCLEKLRELKPEWDEDKINRYTKLHCPEQMGIANDPDWCSMGTKLADCDSCWNRAVPSNKDFCHLMTRKNGLNSVLLDEEDADRLERLIKKLEAPAINIIHAALKLYEDSLDAVENARTNPTSMSFEVMSNE